MPSARLIPLALLALSWLSSRTTAEETRLELVQVLFRSGERTPGPEESYPGDPYKDYSYEPWGRGRLTELGRYRGRRLAQALRRQYVEFLRKDLEDVYAYSLDREDCRESMRSFLDTLLGENGAGKVRINGEHREIDALIMNSRKCRVYRERLEKIRRSALVRKQIARFDGLFRYIKKKIGISVDEKRPDDSLFQLYELLERQRSLNLSLPTWCPKGVLRLLNELATVHLNLQSQTTELKRLNGGPLVRRFLEDARRATGVRAYAAEVEHVAAFARALNRRFFGVPSPGSAVVLETRRAVKDGRLYLRMLVWSSYFEKLFPVDVKGCEELCPLEEYAKIVEKVLPDDWEAKCFLENWKHR